jgi:hypothetical protein
MGVLNLIWLHRVSAFERRLQEPPAEFHHQVVTGTTSTAQAWLRHTLAELRQC